MSEATNDRNIRSLADVAQTAADRVEKLEAMLEVQGQALATLRLELDQTKFAVTVLRAMVPGSGPTVG